MTKIREAFNAGSAKYSGKIEIMQDPVGLDQDHDRLRAMGKWRFVLIRGILGWGVPMFLWLALTHLSEDINSAGRYHQSTFQHLLHSWAGAFLINAFFGLVIGLLAWRRVTSDVWPGAKPDPESSITRLGSLGPGAR